jgi:Uma2 family endonuclease
MMTDQTISPPKAQTELPRPLGVIVATGISADDYMERFAAHHYEWVRGYVIDRRPVTLRHQLFEGYLRDLLDAYFAFNSIGRVIGAPFVMRVDATNSRREPDLQVILKTNPGELTETYMHGPADICIEIVSAESVAQDYGEKFQEYEAGGVREYWIFDPIRTQSHFYRLDENGVYRQILPDAEGNYRTPLLPQFALHVPTLWQDTLPNIVAIVESVRAMLTP